VAGRAEDSEGGRGASPVAEAPLPERRGWWVAASLLLLSAIAALLTIRRFSHTT
jgi:serine protease